MADLNEILSLYTELKSRKSQYEDLFDELALVTYPRRSGFQSEITDGENLQSEIYDSTPQQAARS